MVNCLPYWQGDLSLISWTTWKKMGIMMHACNPSAIMWRQRSLRGLLDIQHSWISEPQTTEYSYFKRKVGLHMRNNTWGWPLASTHMCMWVTVHTCISAYTRTRIYMCIHMHTQGHSYHSWLSVPVTNIWCRQLVKMNAYVGLLGMPVGQLCGGWEAGCVGIGKRLPPKPPYPSRASLLLGSTLKS